MTSIAREASFFRYMGVKGPETAEAKRNYVSWLRYVADIYNIDLANLNESQADKIVEALRESQNTRSIYKSDSAVSNIKSALNKYLAFTSSGAEAPNVINDILCITDSDNTTKKAEIESRLGQGKFRKDLIAIWGKCAVTEFEQVELLNASHIKPWSKSNDRERLDPFNGLLLNPTLDKLFDLGYISFTDDGSLIISPVLASTDIEKLGVTDAMGLYKVETGCLKYLAFHRKFVYVQ